MKKFFQHYKCLTSSGIISSVIGIIFLLTCSTLINYLIDRELVLTPNKHSYEAWKKPPMPITMDFYFFNWLNPEDVRNTSVKPRLEQKGPYVFRETKEKVDVVWNPNGTVSFRQLRLWYFDESKSVGNLSDEITTLNAVAVIAAAQAKNFNFLLRNGLSLSLKMIAKDIHITKTVGELLFEGYRDMLLDTASNFPKIPDVEVSLYDKFGWFYRRNGSTLLDGLLTMGTGTGDIPLGRIDRWNYKQETGFYKDECGRVHGSSGEFWAPHVTKEDLFMFSSDLCRTVGFQFEKEEFVKGIKGYRFTGGDKTMDNGTKYPENLCYCGGECVPSGVLNVTSCRHGAPAFISFPHFYLADPYYVDHFEGLNPNKEEHEVSITVEPRAGVPLAVSAKFQVNLLLTPSKFIRLYSDVPRLFFPIFWVKQEVVLPDNLASDLKLMINLPFAAKMFSIVIIVLGGAILVTLWAIYLFRKRRTFLINKQTKTKPFSKETVPLNESE